MTPRTLRQHCEELIAEWRNGTGSRFYDYTRELCADQLETRLGLPSESPADEGQRKVWFLTKQRSSHDCYEYEYRIGETYAGVAERFVGKIYRLEDAQRVVDAINGELPTRKPSVGDAGSDPLPQEDR